MTKKSRGRKTVARKNSLGGEENSMFLSWKFVADIVLRKTIKHFNKNSQHHHHVFLSTPPLSLWLKCLWLEVLCYGFISNISVKLETRRNYFSLKPPNLSKCYCLRKYVNTLLHFLETITEEKAILQLAEEKVPWLCLINKLIPNPNCVKGRIYCFIW